MADLRELVERLGNTNVRTLLASGNVVFDAPPAKVARLARPIEAAIESRFGFSASVIVVTATDLACIVRENPLPLAVDEPSRYLVAFAPNEGVLANARPLLAQPWAPDAFAITRRAAYMWCVGGIIESKLLKAFERATGGSTTARNWATVLKLHAASVVRKNAT